MNSYRTFYPTVATFMPVLLLAAGFQIGLRGVSFFRRGRQRWIVAVVVIAPLLAAMVAAEIAAILVLDNGDLDSPVASTLTLVGGVGGTVLVALAVGVRIFDEIQELRESERDPP